MLFDASNNPIIFRFKFNKNHCLVFHHITKKIIFRRNYVGAVYFGMRLKLPDLRGSIGFVLLSLMGLVDNLNKSADTKTHNNFKWLGRTSFPKNFADCDEFATD